jgi:hypothetical protein
MARRANASSLRVTARIRTPGDRRSAADPESQRPAITPRKALGRIIILRSATVLPIASIALRLSVSLLLIQGRVWRHNHAEIRTIVLFRLRSLVSKPSSIVLDQRLLSID